MWSLPLTHGHRAETIFASGTARDERAERERAARRKRRGRAECATFSLHTPQRCLVCQWLTKCTIYAHMHARERCLHDTDIYIYIYTQSGPADSESNLGLNRPIHSRGDSSSSFSFSIIYLLSIFRWPRFFLSPMIILFLGKDRMILSFLRSFSSFRNFCEVIGGNIFKVFGWFMTRNEGERIRKLLKLLKKLLNEDNIDWSLTGEGGWEDLILSRNLYEISNIKLNYVL